MLEKSDMLRGIVQANRDAFFENLHFFYCILGFFWKGGGHFEKVISASDRARRALSWSNVGLIGASS